MKGFYYILKGLDIMRAAHINLKQEVTRNDAMVIMNWMKNNEITRYLNETVNITFELQQAIDRVNILILTHLFNREGSFYLIYPNKNEPIGFIKLVKKHKEAEIVIVIGEERRWGQGLGKASIKKGLEIAFFEWRIPRVIAKIDVRNIRSIKAFENSGFLLEYEYTNMKIFSISIDDYIMKLA
jgi:regulator of nucleoside diphosphate kinase